MQSRGKTGSIRGVLGNELPGQVGARSDQEGILSGVERDSKVHRHCIYEEHKSTRNGLDQGGGPMSSGKRCYRASPTQRAGTRGVQHIFSAAKKDRRSQADTQFKATKQVAKYAKVQDGQFKGGYRRIEEGRLDVLSGLEGRVLAHTNVHKAQKISEIRTGKRRTLSVSLPMFRAGNSTENVHQGRVGVRRDGQEIFGSHLPISRRLADSGENREGVSQNEGHNSGTRTEGGVHYQLGEVAPSSREGVRILRCILQPERRFRSGVGREVPENLQRGADGQEGSAGDSTDFAGTFGVDGFMYRDREVGQVAHEANTDALIIPLEHGIDGSDAFGADIQRSDTSLGVVGTEEECSGGSLFESTQTRTDNRNGCMSVGLGGPCTGERQNGTRELDSRGVGQYPYQHFGNESGAEVFTTVQRLGSEQVRETEHRQHNCGSIHTEARGHKVIEIMRRDLAPIEMVQGTECVAGSNAHSRGEERNSRSVIQKEGNANRVAAVSKSGRINLSETRETTNRPVCIQSKLPPAYILHQVPRSRSVSGGRIGHGLGQSVGICVSAHSVDTQSGAKGARQRGVRPAVSSTSVAKETLVHQASAAVVSCANVDTIQSPATDAGQGESSSSQPELIQTGGVACIKRKLKERGFSKTARKLYCAAIRNSTQVVYEGRFSEFVRWCNRRNEDPISCNVDVIVNFIGSLFKRKPCLTHSTICGYRTAISSFHDLIEGKRVGDLPEVSRVVRGVFNLRPPISAGVPLWDLDIVLKGLQNPPFEPLASVHLRWLTLKVVFLVALVTACRSSDLRKLSCEAPFLRERRSPPGYVLVPTELKKQSRVKHLSEEINITKFNGNRLLDPVRALSLYLKRVKVLRKGVKSLFMTYKGGTKGVPSSQTISRWLTDVVEFTYKRQNKSLVNVKRNAHTTRAVSTSWALFNGASVQAILKAADWSSENVFAKHYLRKLEEQRSEFGSAVLSHKPSTA